MKQAIATSPSQSQRLKACWVDPKTADMYYGKATVPPAEYYLYAITDGINSKDWFLSRVNRDIIPAYSLTRLLDLLPKDLTAKGLYYRLVMGPNDKGWEIEYNDLSVTHNLHRVNADTPIECCVQMIEWLAKEGYKLNTIEQ